MNRKLQKYIKVSQLTELNKVCAVVLCEQYCEGVEEYSEYGPPQNRAQVIMSQPIQTGTSEANLNATQRQPCFFIIM